MTDLELEMMVAKVVMGWKPMGGKGSVGGFWSTDKKRTQMVFDSPLHEARKRLAVLDDAPGDGFCFSPLLSASDMWQVIEKMPYKVILQNDGGGGWSVSLCGGGFVTAPTAGRAVCLAAIDAIKG